MCFCLCFFFFFFQAEEGIRDFCLSRGLGDVYKRKQKTTMKQASIVVLPRHEILDHFKKSKNVDPPPPLQLFILTLAFLLIYRCDHILDVYLCVY